MEPSKLLLRTLLLTVILPCNSCPYPIYSFIILCNYLALSQLREIFPCQIVTMIWGQKMDTIYRIAICDDEAADRAFLSSLVKKWGSAKEAAVRVREFTSAENFLFHYAENKEYDILLLDIEMGDMDGISMAKKLRQDNHTIQIVFVTGYSDYIAEGYEVEALHYLLKPLKEEKLFTVLDRAARKLSANEKVLTLTSGGEMVRFPLNQLRYAEVYRNYVTLHEISDFTLKMTLGELEKHLDSRFFRAGRSLIVNLTRISRVTRKEIYLQDGTVLPLPRGVYEKLNRAIINME